MNVNDDFSKRVVMHGDSIAWEDSPMPGVQRRRLDRVQAQNDRVTTIVRYAPESHFSQHVHGGGEEFIVLEGVFQDDYGDWPVGSYIRNPPGSKHTPASKQGCVIFVKLWQFDKNDTTFVHANINKIGAVSEAGRDGVMASTLYKNEYEEVRVETWLPKTTQSLTVTGGVELFVLEGGFSEGEDLLRTHSWLRAPAGCALTFVVGEQGAKVWVKRYRENIAL